MPNLTVSASPKPKNILRRSIIMAKILKKFMFPFEKILAMPLHGIQEEEEEEEEEEKV